MKVSSVAPSGSGAAAQSSTLPSARRTRRVEAVARIVQAGDDAAQVVPSSSPRIADRRRRRRSSHRPASIAASISASFTSSWSSATCCAKAGLDSFSRPSVPNTATPSCSVSSVSPCTRDRARCIAIRRWIALGDVVEEIGDAALRIGVDDDAQRAPVRQIPDLLARLVRLVGRHQARLPDAEIGLLGQPARGAQAVENFGIRRRLVEEGWHRATRAGDRRRCGRRAAWRGRRSRPRSAIGRACGRALPSAGRDRRARLRVRDRSMAMPTEPPRAGTSTTSSMWRWPATTAGRRARQSVAARARFGGGFARGASSSSMPRATASRGSAASTARA